MWLNHPKTPAGLLALIALVGCNSPTEEIEEPFFVEEGGSIFLVDNEASVIKDPTSPQQAVCNPFENNPEYPGGELGLGVVGKLRYLTDEMPRYSSVRDFVQHAAPVDVVMFLDEINVPTRRFDIGFKTEDGDVIKNHRNEVLYEYFSLELEAELKLGSSDRPGKYQFALLSDDGAILEIDDGGGFRTVVDNDGVHPTKMGCATSPMEFSNTSSLPMRIAYHQGPRFHISLILLWREWSDDPSFGAEDTECGKSGNGRYFNWSKTPSEPKDPYLRMLDRGWKVVRPENLALPRAVRNNPCRDPKPAVTTQITGFTPGGSVNNSASVTFTFQSNFANATFECKLDQNPVQSCASGITYTDLADGSHQFTVWAIDPDGVKDPVGVTYSWRIDRIPPMLTFVSVTTDRTTMNILWTTSEPTTSRVTWGNTTAMLNTMPDDGKYVMDHSLQLTGLNPGTVYYFAVGGRDEAGNSFTSSRYAAATKR